MIYSWNKTILQTFPFARNENRNSREIRFSKNRKNRELLYSVWVKIRIYKHGLFGIWFDFLPRKTKNTKKKRANGCYVISIFSNYCHALRAACTRRNAYAYRILWSTFFTKYRKAAHRTLRRMRALFCIGNIGMLGRREGMREETLSVSSNKVFVLPTYFSVTFYITRPYLRAECFAEITCQNAYFLPASKFLFGVGRKNVSMWQNGPLRNGAYYSSYTYISSYTFLSF